MAIFLLKLILPQTLDKDRARREFILNIILLGLSFLSGIALLLNIVQPLIYPHSKGGENHFVTGIIFLGISGLLVLSKKGKGYLATSILLAVFFSIAAYRTYFWGADTGIVLLLFALIVIMAGVLLGSKAAFVFTFLSGLTIMVCAYLAAHAFYHPHDYWKYDSIKVSDSFVNALIFLIIALISWLFNRDLEKTLQRARRSEAALKRQRDKLEIEVEERTAELKRVQAEKLSQLYRFAEFGRTASGLFHDLVNPLNLVSLNLDLLKKHNKKVDQQKISETKVLLKRAISGTQRLESFVDIARKQVQSNDKRQTFSLVDEVKESLQMLEYKASKAYVTVTIQPSETILFFGNPIKFNQLVTNVVSNAIDAYDTVIRKPKRVEIKLQKLKNMLRLEIQDFGIGIKEEMLLNIFDPFFTTKSPGKAMGMGLAICKEIVEKELQGKITVVSKRGEGTTFTIAFPLKKAPQSRN